MRGSSGSISLCYCRVERKTGRIPRVKSSQIIADDLSKAGWSWGCLSAVDRDGRTIWIVDAHRDDGKRFIVRADEKLTAFLELEKESPFRAKYLGPSPSSFRRIE
jgi:hypothetical protein